MFGRVQVVMFRDYVKRGARQRGIVGEVWNNPNGTVELRAEGEECELESLLRRIKRGSLLSRVDSIETQWLPARGDLSRFRILFI